MEIDESLQSSSDYEDTAQPDSPSRNSLVGLNVGGVLYLTTASTLTNRGKNFFSAMLEGRIPTLRDAAGNYFIDRNGKYFEPVLDFLRTGQLYISAHLEHERVIEELRFFCLDIRELERRKGRPKWNPLTPMIELGPLLVTSNQQTVFSIPKQIIPSNAEEVLVYLYIKTEQSNDEADWIYRIFTADNDGKEYSFYVFAHSGVASVGVAAYSSNNFWLPITRDKKIKTEITSQSDSINPKAITSQIFLTGFR
jgi:hypothetical protein